jgi:hypothetical protein
MEFFPHLRLEHRDERPCPTTAPDPDDREVVTHWPAALEEEY